MTWHGYDLSKHEREERIGMYILYGIAFVLSPFWIPFALLGYGLHQIYVTIKGHDD